MHTSSTRMIALAGALLTLLFGCMGDVGASPTYSPSTAPSRAEDDADDFPIERRNTYDPTVKCPDGRDPPLATGLRIRELSLYQTVKIPLYRDGRWVVERAAPIIQAKRTLVRVFVDPLEGYVPHSVRAVLRLTSADRLSAVADERIIQVSSNDAERESTFNLEIDSGSIDADTRISVALEEPSCDAAGGRAADTRLPQQGTRALETEVVGKLRVVMVPVPVGGRVPRLDDAELQRIRAALRAYYPVPDVEVRRHAPIAGVEAISPHDEAAIEDVLQSIKELRAREAPDADVYYVGAFQPAASSRAYCETGCILGLAPQSAQVQPREQCAVGAFFAEPMSYETIVHELAHAHGRGHAPCEQGGLPRAVDGSYPSANGVIGDWGWDNRSGSLISPAYKDIMTYCAPNWISAYTYRALAERARRVNTQALVQSGGPSSWRSVLLHGNGRARWSGAIETSAPPGQRQTARVLDQAGATIQEVPIVRVPLSHTQGEFVYLPEPGAQWFALEWDDRRLELGAVLPPFGSQL